MNLLEKKQPSPIISNPRGSRIEKRYLKNKMWDGIFGYVCRGSAIILVLILFSIVFLMTTTGILVFRDVPVTTFLFSPKWIPEDGYFGAGIFLFGTLALTGLTLLLASPIAVGVAIFLAEIAPPTIKNLMRPVLELLVGIPSIVYGYLGLTVLIPGIRKIFDVNMGDGLLAAAVVLALMVLPTIACISDDAITAVPQSYREASYALGSTGWQTITRVVIPSAMPGIIAANVLGMARALGETMAVVMVIGNTPQMPSDLFTPTSVITSNIVMQLFNIPFDSTWSHALYMKGTLLLVVSLALIILLRLTGNKGGRMT